MSEKKSNSESGPDFSLVLGGPLYQLYLRTRLAREPLELLHRRIIVITLWVWLPLAILTIVSGQAFGGVKVPFFFDLDVHAKYLLGLPLLIAAELVIHRRLAPVPSLFLERGIISPEDRPRFDQILSSTRRLRNSVWIEVFLLIFVFTAGHVIWRNYTSLSIDTWYAAKIENAVRLTPAGYWYAFVSTPLFQFILFRWYFRLFLWYRFLWKVSRLNLQLLPNHPDRSGGLSFLGGMTLAFSIVLVAHTVILAGTLGNHIFHEGATLLNYKLEILGVILFLLLIVLTPLTFFLLLLRQMGRLGAKTYGTFASRYVRDFGNKWLGGQAPNAESPLGSSDIQSLADLANSYEVIGAIRSIPISRQTVVQMVILMAVPLFPLLLTMVPLEKMVDKFLGILF